MPYKLDALRWNGWGLLSEGFDFRGREDDVWRFFADAVGRMTLPHTPPLPLDACRLPPSALPETLRGALSEVTAFDASDAGRARHARGRSYPDLLGLRSGDLGAAPDAVVYPETEDEVVAILRACNEAGAAVVPFGGGSSVVGGVQGKQGSGPSVTLDTTRMAACLGIDGASRIARFQAGIYGPDLETALSAQGWMLGHHPQSFRFSTLGGWIAARGAGQLSNGYGTADDWLVAARMVTPVGVHESPNVPRSAAGPDLRTLALGSEGTLGIITEAAVRISPIPARRSIQTYLLRSFEAGLASVRSIAQDGLPVSMVRLSDADETRFYGRLRNILEPASAGRLRIEAALAAAGYGAGRCVLMVGAEGERADVRRTIAAVARRVLREGGLPVGGGPGRSWFARRFASAYLRDPMLDRGLGIDTLETSVRWSEAATLHAAVRQALKEALGQGEGQGEVLAHVSHTYPDGCSLYFIFLFARDEGDPLGQWLRIKTVATDAIIAGGGALSHHHGVGRDHRPWLADAAGPLGVGALRWIKASVDPAGIMNPGALVPSDHTCSNAR